MWCRRLENEIENVDCAFTSPPYFSTERYNEGGDKQELQSWFKFNEYESWRDNFYLPVSQNTFDSLSDNGVMLINILDPKVKGKRYRSGDELVDMLLPNFMGQVGMRIMQRPQGASVFKDENGKFDKAAMDRFMNKIYIENIWYFSKNKNFDLFRHTKRGTLEDRRLFEDIKFTDEQLQPTVDWCKSKRSFALITKFNKQKQWTAISIRGYADDMKQIGKGGVLGTTELSNLQNTPLYDELEMDKILDEIPAEKERVRMKLRAGTKIAKHTDKVDKDIKSGKIIRLHIPVVTNENVVMKSWLKGGIAEFRK